MSTASEPTDLASDDKKVIQRQIETKSKKHEHIQELYEINRTVARIKEGNYKRIALQFPDEYLADAAHVAKELVEKTGQEIFVLADTSYGSCCVDEVAAEHVNADLIVHYGRSCLSPTSRSPVLYVFGRQSIDLEQCKKEFQMLFPDLSQPVIIMSDVEYAHCTESLTAELAKAYQHIIPTVIQTESNLQHMLNKPSSTPPSSTSPSSSLSHGGFTGHEERKKNGEACCGKCDRDFEDAFNEEDNASSILAPATHADVENLMTEKKKGGRYFELPEGIPMESCSIFFIGKESLTLTNIMMVHNKCPVFTYNPKTKEARKESVQVNRLLMKRYALLQAVKDAETIGIVVGTLGVASYMNIIDHIKKIIKASGRKSYFFVMGKLNAYKMANFMEIDCFVLVSCPENSLIDSKEFCRPMVTPFELEIALIRDMEWVGDYITDFSMLLPQLRTDGFSYDEEQDQDASSDGEPHSSLITGQCNSDSSELLTSTLTGLTLRSKDDSIARLLNSTAGEYFQNRTYKGLEANIGQDEATDVQEGLSGIASRYVNEQN
ncbi:diphthamide biosynthesis protein 2 [Parasitella parasitica]|nr:diphthamide biosynthesis protein 2 [Parasitella parasitica]